jgi:outer membrane cobalamin receptor
MIRELYINRDQNQKGIEFEFESPELLGFLKPFLNITGMKSKMMSGTGMVVNRENPVLITSSGIYLEKWNMDLNVFFKYVSPFENARFAPKTAGPQPLGDFLSIDLNGGYTLKGKVPVRFWLRIRNLTDRRYSTVIGYPDFGRTIYLGMHLSFAKERSLKD